MSTNTALILIDYINEIVHADGKLSGKGYTDFIERHGTAKSIEALTAHARSKGWLICHVGVGFSPNYKDHPGASPLFGAAKQYGALNRNEWGCQFVDYSTPTEDDLVINKPRVSAFHNTTLEAGLRSNGITDIVVAGCSTDLAVQSAARDAHDRDYKVVIASDACAAATDDDHHTSLELLKKIASVMTVSSM